MAKEHLKFNTDRGYLTLLIDDWELFDFVDDFLAKHDLDFEFYDEVNTDSGTLYQMYFKNGIDEKRLKKAIASLDEKEIQRIWERNN